MAEKNRYNFVDRNLLSGWSEDGVHVQLMNPFTGEEEENAEIGNLYQTDIEFPHNLLEEFVSSMDDIFPLFLKDMKEDDFSFLYDDNMTGRSSLLFQLKRADIYIRAVMSEGSLLSDLLEDNDEDDSEKTGLSEKVVCSIKGFYLLGKMSSIFDDSFLLMRFDPVLLHAPEGSSFILGPSPMNIMNPFFERRHPEENEVNEYLLSGACLIMPLSPSTALCLYDHDIYKVRKRGGRCLLTPQDVNVLNMIQLYNGGRNYGYVHKGGWNIEYEEIERAVDHSQVTCSPYNDSYPFNTELSCLFIQADVEEHFSFFYDKPVPAFVKDMQKYNDEFNNRVNASDADYEKERRRRFVYAYNYLFEDTIEE